MVEVTYHKIQISPNAILCGKIVSILGVLNSDIDNSKNLEINKSQLQKNIGITGGGRKYQRFNTSLNFLVELGVLIISKHPTRKIHYVNLTNLGFKIFKEKYEILTDNQEFPFFILTPKRVSLLNMRFFFGFLLLYYSLSIIFSIITTRELGVYVANFLVHFVYLIFSYAMITFYRWQIQILKDEGLWDNSIKKLNQNKVYTYYLPIILAIIIALVRWPFQVIFAYGGTDLFYESKPYPLTIQNPIYLLFMIVGTLCLIWMFANLLHGTLFLFGLPHNNSWYNYIRIVDGNEKENLSEDTKKEYIRLFNQQNSYFNNYFINLLVLSINLSIAVFIIGFLISYSLYDVFNYMITLFLFLIPPLLILTYSLYRYWHPVFKTISEIFSKERFEMSKSFTNYGHSVYNYLPNWIIYSIVIIIIPLITFIFQIFFLVI
ncbi:MAG: hypothetical protein ACXAC7_05275 [Candidatus Hodarchaeales archaeon]|jgi:hypothetical protein